MYQPEESGSEREHRRESDAEEVPAASEEGATDDNEEDVRDAREEGVNSTNEKADSILNFLKSTQEIYVYDGMFFPVFLLNNGIHLENIIKHLAV